MLSSVGKEDLERHVRRNYLIVIMFLFSISYYAHVNFKNNH